MGNAKLFTMSVLVVLFILVSGCSNEVKTGKSDAQQAQTKPVTVTVLLHQSMTDEEFQKYIAGPVKQKYPYITVESQRLSKGQNLSHLVAAGIVPDIVYTSPGGLVQTFSEELPLDLTSLIKANGFDLGRFRPDLLKAVKIRGSLHGPKEGVYSIPFSENTVLLWYNKDIFDKFGVPYPKDGMLWSDAQELARKLTRFDGGVQYRGLEPLTNNGSINNMASSLSLQLIDPKTDKAVISDKWKEVFNQAMGIYNIPGNKLEKMTNTQAAFLKDQNVAMAPLFWNDASVGVQNQIKDNALHFQWDIVQPPSFPEAPNVGFNADYHQFVIMSTSKHPDAAFKVLRVATSDEVQLAASKAGRIPVISNPKVQKAFASDAPLFKGKNVKAVFKSHPSVPPVNIYNGFVSKAIQDAFNSVYAGKMDVNTALHQAEEQANKSIAEEKAK